MGKYVHPTACDTIEPKIDGDAEAGKDVASGKPFALVSV